MRKDTESNTVSGRGEATRGRLIAAALQLFGQRGYEGVGAREITKAAGVPLSAIPYHFGTKQALYRAVIERITGELAEALAPAAAAASAALSRSQRAASDALAMFQGRLLDVIAANPESEAWSKLLLREHMDPGPAFDLVYDDAARGAIELMAALIGRTTQRDADDPAVLIEAFARMGEILVFRTLQAAVVKRLGWTELRSSQAAQIHDALIKRPRALDASEGDDRGASAKT